MNCCRTCKHWSVNADMIGVGLCVNFDAQYAVMRDTGGLRTAQNFGCVHHESGESNCEVHTREDQLKKLREFLLDRFDTEKP